MPEPASVRDLRSFGLVVGGVFAVIGLWPLLRDGGPARVWALAPAAPLLVSGLLFPRALRHPFRAWMLVGHSLGWVNTRLLMTVLFYAVFTPTALVMRVMKRDAMTRRLDPAAASYRVVKTPRRPGHTNRPF